jgi:Legionella pneumophila major outer membrane protein precursor
MKHVFYSLLAISPLLLQAERADTDYEHVYLDQEECMLEEILEKELAETELSERLAQKTDASSEATLSQNESGRSMPSRDNQSGRAMQNSYGNCPALHPGWFADAEFLWWKLDETGMDYAAHKNEGQLVYDRPSSGPNDGMFGTIHSVDFEWSPGFRVGLGYRFPRDLWELSGVYTFYFTDGSDKVKIKGPDAPNQNDPASEIIQTFFEPDIGNIILAKANAQFWYHIGDVQLARQFCATPYITLRFSVGPTIAFIQQKFNSSFSDNFGLPPQVFEPSQTTTWNLKWNFKGAGVKLGLGSDWNLWRGLNLSFGGAFSSVYGMFENTNFAFVKGNPNIPEPSPSGSINDATIKSHRVLFGAQLLGGIKWKQKFCNGEWELFLNYEMNTWLNFTDQYRPMVDNEAFFLLRELQTPPFNLKGITAGIGIGF